MKSQQNRKLNIELVEKVVLKYFGITSGQLLKRNRGVGTIERKQMFHYLCKIYTIETLKSIGKYKNYSYSHCSVLHSVNRIQEIIDTEPKWEQIWYDLNLELAGMQRVQIDQNNSLDVLIKSIVIDLLLCKSKKELLSILLEIISNRLKVN